MRPSEPPRSMPSQTSGFGWVRQRFPWDAIEPEPGMFAWQPWDAIVEDVTQRNLTLVAVLDGSPGWARAPEDAGNPLAPPQQRADLGRFAEAFAKRYGQVLRFYQVWDEPNIQPHWGQGLVDAAEYAGLLREAAVQLRAADPDAAILAAALAPNSEPGGLNQSDITLLGRPLPGWRCAVVRRRCRPTLRLRPAAVGPAQP